jgi:predicted alpha/beta-hydrolase family hydrolase
MAAPPAIPLALEVGPGTTVTALLRRPDDARIAYVFAHGAGAGMEHAFMAAVAAGLGARAIATLRYQFPFMQRGSKRTDPPAVAHASVRAAVALAAERLAGLPLFAGGKSFGGRMTSQAQASAPLPSVRGLVFFGFPLHAAQQPARERATHLAQVGCPMLFLQGTRDELADLGLIRAVTSELGPRATLAVVDDADHAFHVRAKSGRNDAQVLESLLDTTAAWMTSIVADRPGMPVAPTPAA